MTTAPLPLWRRPVPGRAIWEAELHGHTITIKRGLSIHECHEDPAFVVAEIYPGTLKDECPIGRAQRLDEAKRMGQRYAAAV